MHLISIPGKTATIIKEDLTQVHLSWPILAVQELQEPFRLTVFVKSVARHLKALNVVQHHYWIRLQIDSGKDINFTLNNNVNK